MRIFKMIGRLLELNNSVIIDEFEYKQELIDIKIDKLKRKKYSTGVIGRLLELNNSVKIDELNLNKEIIDIKIEKRKNKYKGRGI